MSVYFPIELRQALMKVARRNNINWIGRMTYVDFFSSFMNLKAMHSEDLRFDNAYADMRQHTENNFDWSEKDILADDRFNPLRLSDEHFGDFLTNALSIDNREEQDLKTLIELIDPILNHFGLRTIRHEPNGIFEGYKVLPMRAHVSNQGRGHSQNPAPLEHAGLHFRSQPEIELFEALVQEGYLLAPLPVFVQKGRNGYMRCEPDFIIVRYGIWAVIEVDGQAWHQETPAQAHARLQGFMDQNTRVIRVPASIASGPQWARRSVEFINERFQRWRESR